jgi:hypothetical protein
MSKDHCGPFLKNYVKKVRRQGRITQVKDNIKDTYGQHNIINYKPEYNFQESW